jgi:DNA-binding LacI/PurR family transcriptional regulator
MSRLLDLDNPPDAVFCFSDPLALGALRTLHEHGVRVPDDIAVVGFDDIEDGRYSTPTLSSISPDKKYIAAKALDLLSARLDGTFEPPRAYTAPFGLEIRESSTISR